MCDTPSRDDSESWVRQIGQAYPTAATNVTEFWGGAPVTALSKGAVVFYLVAWYHCRYGSVTMSCCPWAAGDQQGGRQDSRLPQGTICYRERHYELLRGTSRGGRQGSRLPQGTICYRERHYELLPVGCWRPAGG